MAADVLGEPVSAGLFSFMGDPRGFGEDGRNAFDLLGARRGTAEEHFLNVLDEHLDGQVTPKCNQDRVIRRSVLERLAIRARRWRTVMFSGTRHFLASLLIASGADIKTVQARMRHSSATTTLNTYSHLWPDADESTRTAVGKVITARLRSAAVPLRSQEGS